VSTFSNFQQKRRLLQRCVVYVASKPVLALNSRDFKKTLEGALDLSEHLNRQFEMLKIGFPTLVPEWLKAPKETIIFDPILFQNFVHFFVNTQFISKLSTFF
jgi:hypothetical protein